MKQNLYTILKRNYPPLPTKCLKSLNFHIYSTIRTYGFFHTIHDFFGIVSSALPPLVSFFLCEKHQFVYTTLNHNLVRIKWSLALCNQRDFYSEISLNLGLSYNYCKYVSFKQHVVYQAIWSQFISRLPSHEHGYLVNLIWAISQATVNLNLK